MYNKCIVALKYSRDKPRQQNAGSLLQGGHHRMGTIKYHPLITTQVKKSFINEL